jgi:ABC-2 type transport system permease protein
MPETGAARERIGAGPAEAPPLWWVLVRLEWRLTIRDYFNAAGRRRKSTATARSKPVGSRRAIIGLVVFQLLLHAMAVAVTWWFPRRWHDTAMTRMAVVAVFAFVGTFMLSTAMSRVVAAFHERRDLDLLLSAPVSPTLLLAIRTATVAVATLSTFAFFVFPFVDVGVILGRWWMARLYLLLPLIALIMTSIALSLTDLVVRLVGARRARIGLQIFSALVGASIYLVSQAVRSLPTHISAGMRQWFASITRVDDAPWPVEFIARLARGDGSAWSVL